MRMIVVQFVGQHKEVNDRQLVQDVERYSALKIHTWQSLVWRWQMLITWFKKWSSRSSLYLVMFKFIFYCYSLKKWNFISHVHQVFHVLFWASCSLYSWSIILWMSFLYHKQPTEVCASKEMYKKIHLPSCLYQTYHPSILSYHDQVYQGPQHSPEVFLETSPDCLENKS